MMMIPLEMIIAKVTSNLERGRPTVKLAAS